MVVSAASSARLVVLVTLLIVLYTRYEHSNEAQNQSSRTIPSHATTHDNQKYDASSLSSRSHRMMLDEVYHVVPVPIDLGKAKELAQNVLSLIRAR